MSKSPTKTTNKIKIDLEFIKSLFLISSPSPSPPFPLSFTNLIPKVSLGSLKRPEVSENDLKTYMHLDYNERFSVLSMIKEYKSTILLSDENKKYAGVLILQSLCSIYYVDLESFDSESFRLLFYLIRLCFAIVPEYFHQINSFFVIFYTTLSTNARFIELLPSISKCFRNQTQTNSSFINPHISSCISIISYCMSSPSITVLKLAISHFNRTVIDMRTLRSITIGLQRVSELYNLSAKAIEHSFNKFDDTKISGMSEAFQYSILFLCIEISRHSFEKYSYIVSFIKERVLSIPLVNKDDFSGILKPFDKVNIESLVDSPSINGKMNDYQIPQFSSFAEYISSFSHPSTLFFENIFCLPHVSIIHIIDILLSSGRFLIENEDIDFIAIVLHLISSLSKQYADIVNLIVTNSSYGIFFSKRLYTPTISVFSKPSSLLLPIRHMGLRVLDSLFFHSTPPELVSDLFSNLLQRLVVFPELFSEIVYFSKNMLFYLIEDVKYQEIMFLAFSDSICIQYNEVIKKSWNYIPCLIILFRVLEDIIKKNHCLNIYCLRESGLEITLVHMLSDGFFSNMSANIIHNILFHFYDPRHSSKINDLFNPLIDSLYTLFSHYEKSQSQVYHILMILSRSFSSLSKQAIVTLGQSLLFPIVYDILLVSYKNKQIFEICYSLLFYIVTSELDEIQRINWAKVSDCVRMNCITPFIVSETEKLISGRGKLDHIMNHRALVLLFPLLESEFRNDILLMIKSLTIVSITNCYILYKEGFAEYLMKILLGVSMSINEKVLCFSIIENIIVFSCSLSTYYSFLKFIRFNNEQDPKTDVIALKSLLNIASQHITSMNNFIYLFDKSDFFRLPNVIPSCFPNGFVVSAWALLNNFYTLSDSIVFIDFRGKKQFFKCTISSTKVCFESNMFSKVSQVEFDYHISFNKWTQFTLSFAQNGEITLDIDGLSVCTSVLKTGIWNDEFVENFMFEQQVYSDSFNNYTMILVGSISFYHYPLTTSKTVFSKDSYFEIDSSSFWSYSPIFVDKDKMLDYKGVGSPIVFCGTLYLHIPSFLQIFSKFKGLEYILSCLEVDIEKISDVKSYVSYFSLIIEFLFCILQVSDINQIHFSSLHGFRIVGCVLRCIPKQEIGLSLWHHLCQIERCIRESNLLIEYYQYVLFDYSIWFACNADVSLDVLIRWKNVVSKEPTNVLPFISFVKLIQYMKNEFSNNTLTLDRQSHYLHMLRSLFIIETPSDSIEKLMCFLFYISDNVSLLLFSLKKITKIISSDHRSLFIFVDTIYKSEFILNHPNPLVHSTIVQLIVAESKESIDKHLLLELRAAKIRNNDLNTFFLSHFSSLFVGKPSSSFENLIEICNSWVIQPIYAGYVFLLANIVSSDKLFVEFISKSLEKLSSLTITPFSLFLLVSFVFIKCPHLMNKLVYFVASSPILCLEVYCIIDYMSSFYNLNLHVHQNSFTASLIQKAIVSNTNEILVKDFISIVIRYLLCHPCTNSAFENKIQFLEGEYDPLDFMSHLRCVPRIVHNFSLYLTDGLWSDILITDFFIETSLLKISNEQDIGRLLALLAFSLCPTNPISKHSFELLEIFVQILPSDSMAWNTVLHQVLKSPDVFRICPNFWRAFEQKLSNIKDIEFKSHTFYNWIASSFDSNCEIIQKLNYLASDPNIVQIVIQDDSTFNHKVVDVLSIDMICTKYLNQMGFPLCISSEKSWNDTFFPLSSIDMKTFLVNGSYDCLLIQEDFEIPIKLCIDYSNIILVQEQEKLVIPLHSIQSISITKHGTDQNCLTVFDGSRIRFFEFANSVKLEELFDKKYDENINKSVLIIQNRWLERKISSFEYIIYLNFLSGRNQKFISNNFVAPQIQNNEIDVQDMNSCFDRIKNGEITQDDSLILISNLFKNYNKMVMNHLVVINNSEQIPRWIDYSFGYLSTGLYHRTLFRSPHPDRNQKETVGISPQFIHGLKSCALDLYHMIIEDNLVFGGLLDNMSFVAPNMTITINIQKQSPYHINSSNGLFSFVDLHNNLHVFSILKQVLVQSSHNPHINAITCIKSIGNKILTTGNDGIVSLWHFNNLCLSFIDSIPNIGVPILSIETNTVFSLVYILYNDNTVVIRSLYDLSYVSAFLIDLMISNLSFSVTKHLGLILISNQSNSINVYSMKGEIIHNFELPCVPKLSCIAWSHDGEDYFIICSNTNKFYKVEFSPIMRIVSLFDSPKTIISIHYIPETSQIASSCQDSSILLFNVY